MPQHTDKSKKIDALLPVPAIELIPHRDAMLLISSLNGYTEDTGYAALQVSNGTLLLNDDGQLDEVAFVELLAQAIAAHSGFGARMKSGEPKVGFLVGLKNFNIFDAASTGDALGIHIIKDTQFDQVSFVNGTIKRGKKTLAEGLLKLWEMERSQYKSEKPSVDTAPPGIDAECGENLFETQSTSRLDRALAKQITHFHVSEDKRHISARLCFKTDFIGFSGHFPENPILPGILILKSARFLGELGLKKALRIKTIRQAKFARTIFPQQIITIEVQITANDDGYKLAVQLRRNEALYAKFSMDVIDV